MDRFSWYEVGDAPNQPGVYAWYYSPDITDYDLKNSIDTITALREAGNVSEARRTATQFLEETVYRSFKEDSYQVDMRGPLKPRYYGEIEHISPVSDSLLDRIVDDPNRLITLRNVLKTSAPEFASPIYIGMSKRLRARLNSHKALIERYAEDRSMARSEGDRDHSFAYEITKRGIPPTKLFVYVTAMKEINSNHVDVEHVLNRIHYPLLGRN